MQFNYTSHSGIRLTQEEEQLLEKIDNFQYSLQGFSDIGGIHNSLLGGVVLSNQKKSRHYSYEMTVAECMAKIKELDAEISRINDKLSILYTRYKEARNNNDDDKANRIEKEMGSYGWNVNRLGDMKAAYQNACQKALNGKCMIECDIVITGEYDSSLNQVILYYKSISSEELLAVVYVHEMMHAYFDRGGITLPEIEEPIVEYGMLCFFKTFGDAKLLKFAQEEVKNKQNTIGIAHYGFGHCIYKNDSNINWLEIYRNTKPRLSNTSPNVENYLDFWRTGTYPFGKEQYCLIMLYLVVDHSNCITQAIDIIQYKNGKIKKQNQSIKQTESNEDYLVKLQQAIKNGTLPPKNLPTPLNEEEFRNDLKDLKPINEDNLSPRAQDSYRSSIKNHLAGVFTKHRILDSLGNSLSVYNCDNLLRLIGVYEDLVHKNTDEAKEALNGTNRAVVNSLRIYIKFMLLKNNITI